MATVASKIAMLQNFRDDLRAQRALLHDDTHRVRRGDRGRRRLQQRADRAAGARVGAREPAGARASPAARSRSFLLGELAIELAVAIPLGCLLGYLLSWAIVAMSHTDMIAIPIVVAPRTYAFAALAIVLAGAASALIVRRRIDRLDLVGVLKTRECDEQDLVAQGLLDARRRDRREPAGLGVRAAPGRGRDGDRDARPVPQDRRRGRQDARARPLCRVGAGPRPAAARRPQGRRGGGAGHAARTASAGRAGAARRPYRARVPRAPRSRRGHAAAGDRQRRARERRARAGEGGGTRATKLADQGFASRQALDNAQREVELKTKELAVAQFDGHAAEHQVAMAQAALNRYRQDAGGKSPSAVWEIRSPVAGRVLRVVQESEAIVASGAPILEIGDPRALEVVVDVLTADAAAIRPGHGRRARPRRRRAAARRPSPPGRAGRLHQDLRAGRRGAARQCRDRLRCRRRRRGAISATAIASTRGSPSTRVTTLCWCPSARYSGTATAGRCLPCPAAAHGCGR